MLNGDGLVGRVVEVGPWTSTVLLAVDPDFRAGVRLESSMDIGFVTGKGERPLTLDLLDGQARVAEGDRLVTFGSVNDRPFVPGVPVGEVTSVQATPGLADQDRDGRARTSTSPGSTWSASSSSRRGRTRATACCRPSRRPPRCPR